MSSGTNKTNPIQSFLRLPDDPNARFEANEVNTEVDRINTFINNNITTSLLTTNTAQTVSGAKVFDYLFYTGTSNPSYNSVMDTLNNNISPGFGNGYKGIVNTTTLTTSDIKKLGFTNQNVSGINAPIALNNPVFLKSSVKIYNTDTTTISVTAKNVPLSAYDQNKSGTSPSQGNSANAKFWNTSVSYQGTIASTDFIGGFNSTAFESTNYSIILAKKDTSTTADCLVVRSGSESSINTDYKSFKKIGFFIVYNGAIWKFSIFNNCYTSHYYISSSTNQVKLNYSDLGNSAFDLTTNTFGLIDIIKSNCVIEVLLDDLNNSGERPLIINSSTYITSDAFSTSKSRKADVYRIPMIWDGTSYNTVGMPSASSSSSFYLRKIYFGSLQ